MCSMLYAGGTACRYEAISCRRSGQVLTNGLLGQWDFSLANVREPDFRDLAAKSATAAVFACLDGMYSEDDASATLEFREEVE